MVDKRKCTVETIGKVVKLVNKGIHSATVITVQYIVDGQVFEVEESVKKKHECIKIGFFPIGQRTYPVMGAISVGSEASVTYNPNKPAEAFITKNTGIFIG